MNSADIFSGSGSDLDSGSISAVIVPLLKGVMYQENDPSRWNSLLYFQSRIRDYMAVLGLELVLDEAEGYAFLKSRKEEDGDETSVPRLVVRRPLSFPVSLLLALLRRKLAEFDASGSETRLILSRDQIVELIRVFLPEGSNETKLIDQVDSHINKVIDLGFLRQLKDQKNTFEVRRILKSFVDAQWLSEMDKRLAEYLEHMKGIPDSGSVKGREKQDV